MKGDIYVAPYRLELSSEISHFSKQNSREGFLLKINGGYADCHPWPEWGDLEASLQLEALRQGHLTPLLERALAIAALDAEARASKKSLFEGLSIPPSHKSLPELLYDPEAAEKIEKAYEESFAKIKIKVGADLNQELSLLKKLAPQMKSLKLRLDFNSRAEMNSIEDFLQGLGVEILDRVDFLEDPMPYENKAWRALSQKWSLHLAKDKDLEVKELHSEAFDIAVLKSALLDPLDFVQEAADHIERLVVTSYLDHPLGQAAAAYYAARLSQSHPLLIDEAGLLTHSFYKNNAYSERFMDQGPVLPQPGGLGLGFDDLLEREAWKKLS